MIYSADKYAYFIIHRMLRLEEGERLTLHANEETIEFAHKVAHEAAESSGVTVSLVYIENGRVESVDEIAPSYREKEAKSDCLLNLASFTPSEFREDEELDAPSLQRHRLLSDPVFLDRRISIPYAVAYVPTAAWAQFIYGAGATADRLWLDLADFLSLDDEDASSAEKILTQRAAVLNSLGIRSLQLEADNISLSADLADGARITTTAMNLNGRRFFCPSLPCEDLIFPVNFRSARGSFRSTYPFRLFDRVFDSASFTVKDGKIASASGIEPAYINRYMNIDERAAFAGEIILCESLTQPAKTDLAFGIPLLDRMRSSEVVFGGISPEAVTLDDETQLEASGLNTSFARLEVPVGSRQLSVAAKLSDGRTVSIFEDGVFALGI